MAPRKSVVLHRDDPDKDPLVGHIRVTREDWLNIARDTLETQGVAAVKVMALSERLGVARSSFYWYFKNRADLLSALLATWEARNTAQIITHCEKPAANISEALCNFFRCFVDPSIFDRGLDFAVRDWARRDAHVRGLMDHADAARVQAVTAMFARFGYGAIDADARARIVYFMQLGYHALEVREPIPVRMSRLAPYLRGFSGQEPDAKAIRDFLAFVQSLDLP